LCFCFSSRRRHTRSKRDWSSDVCSSDLWPQTLIDLGTLKKNSIVTKLFQKMEKYLYKKADLIISVLPNAEEHITKYNINKDKIVHLPNGIDINNLEKAIQKKFIVKEVV